MIRINKKAIELSVNFLVVIIIAIAVLSLSFLFLKDIFTKAEDIRLDIDRQTEQRMEELLDDGSRIVIPFTKKTIKKGDLGIFGVGVLNVLGYEEEFTVNVSISDAFAEDKSRITTPDTYLYIIPASQLIISIRNNDNHKFSFGADVQKNAPAGTYIIDVNVTYDAIGADGNPDTEYGELGSGIQKVFVLVP